MRRLFVNIVCFFFFILSFISLFTDRRHTFDIILSPIPYTRVLVIHRIYNEL